MGDATIDSKPNDDFKEKIAQETQIMDWTSENENTMEPNNSNIIKQALNPNVTFQSDHKRHNFRMTNRSS